jgi:hypothetical protein
MKTGIYISGLAQSFATESVEKYATRLMNEMSFDSNGVGYELKTEKVNYGVGRESSVVSICEKNKEAKVVYKLYDFEYHDVLTEKFNSHSLIVKNIKLFLLVIRKFPMIFLRMFSSNSYNRPGQTFYLFTIFLIITCAILLMLPATIKVVCEFLEQDKIVKWTDTIFGRLSFASLPSWLDIPGISISKMVSIDGLNDISAGIISVTAVALLFRPNANALISNLATEFVCANNYIQHGTQKQVIQGNLELLVDYITEKDPDCKIHFHSYSFGTIVALDFVYPYGNSVTKNAEHYCEAIITIGTPFEFIKSYYEDFYKKRKLELGDRLVWINIYSIGDALGTNFRRDARIGEAEFGIEKTSAKPININYEVAYVRRANIINIVTLYHIKAHGMYWDSKPEGQSCMRYVYSEMGKQKLI